MEQPQNNWLDNTVLCSITVRRFGTLKQVKAGELDDTIGGQEIIGMMHANTIKLTKKLLDAPELNNIVSFDNRYQVLFRHYSVPNIFKHGIYAVPISLLQKWETHVQQYVTERAALVEQFLQVYEDAVRQAQNTLGVLFSDTDYPTVTELRSRFRVDVHYMELSVPKKLQRVSPELYYQAQQELCKKIEEGKQYIEHVLCEEILTMVHDLSRILKGLDDGEPKKLHFSRIEKIEEWCSLFRARNVTDFQALADVVRQLQETVSGVDKIALKREDVRQCLRKELSDTLRSLTFIKETRKIVLDD